MVDEDLRSGHAWEVERETETLDEARAVLSLLREPVSWEIVHLSRADLGPMPSTLGFDLGWWSGPYSIIWDTVVCPTWHPPDPSDFDRVAERLRGLNQHVLFQSPQDAIEYRSWYESRDWAEKDDFVVVRIDATER